MGKGCRKLRIPTNLMVGACREPSKQSEIIRRAMSVYCFQKASVNYVFSLGVVAVVVRCRQGVWGKGIVIFHIYIVRVLSSWSIYLCVIR